MIDDGSEHIDLSLKESFSTELRNILKYWSTVVVDEQNGGFYGKVANDNSIIANADKGAVLNARILWSFSAAFNLTQKQEYLPFAKRSFDYISEYFIDYTFGGVYWSVDAKGNPSDTKKQIYAIAFTVYGLTEYYRAVQDEKALEIAKNLFYDIEKHSYDHLKEGYFEAFTRSWNAIDDLRLSEKDANEKKTMNTHLHIIEAYTNLYRIWPDEILEAKIRQLIGVFRTFIIDQTTGHLNLFFDENWRVKSSIISYGHDIEASWLLLEAAEVLKDEVLINHVKELSLKIADVSVQGLNAEGAMNYEFDPSANHLIEEKHWWVQAEAMVGFFNAWQLSGKIHFLEKSLAVWDFTKKYIIDSRNGEWFWGLTGDKSVIEGEDKAGFWKCPYHNSRACIELISRIK